MAFGFTPKTNKKSASFFLRCDHDHQELFIRQGWQVGILFLIYYFMHFLPRTSRFALRPIQSLHYLQQLCALCTQGDRNPYLIISKRKTWPRPTPPLLTSIDLKCLDWRVSETELPLVFNSVIVLNRSTGLKKENDQESVLRISGYINQSRIERLRSQRAKKGGGLCSRHEREPQSIKD